LEKQANAFYDRYEYDKALPLYERLLSANPELVEYHFKRGRCLMVLMDEENARKEFQYSIKHHYRKSSALHNIATTYLLVNPPVALNYYKEAFKEDPNDEKTKLLIKILDSVMKKSQPNYDSIFKTLQ
jgi:tetratricopeptide (TPR) repeat protein